MSLALDGIPGHYSPELEANVVIESIVNASVQPGHRLLFGDPRELRSLLRKEMSEYRVEGAGAARVARRI